jgi:hypothetical protein
MGIDTVWDWYFMATGWAVQESTDIERNEPVAIIINTIPDDATKIVNIRANYFELLEL